MLDEKEYHKEYDRVYYQENKEKLQKRCREYYHKNKEKVQKYNKDNKKHKTILICKQCKKEFEVTGSCKNRKFCSYQCSGISQRKERITLICKQCGKEFEVEFNNKARKYCSQRCMGMAIRKGKIKLICKQCKKEFEVLPCDKNRKYCSQKCYGMSKRYVKLSEEYREKIRLAWEKRTESSGYPRNYLCPNFNLNSVTIYKILDKVLHTRSRYGGTKVGEKKIGRYFVDYFNKKYQFIIEWNEEEWHNNTSFYPEGYDAKKRRYILTKYPDYTYITIKQDRWFKKGGLTEEITTKIVDHILKKLRKKR